MTLTTTKPAALRNRVRVTNKTRLRIFRNPRDDDIGHGDDGEAVEGISTAGVDLEDAKEHHLQAVLSAARKQTEGCSQSAAQKDEPTVFIPIPDHAGLVADYDEIYSAGRFTDPETFFKCSSTVEENITAGLREGFTYYMDEQDKEWLDAWNGSCSAEPPPQGRTVRAKAKDGQASTASAFPATYDEFELVMGLLDMITDRKAPLLYSNHNGNAPYPPLLDYQDVLSRPLPPSCFSNWTVPSWVPHPPRMLSLVEAVFAYWQERRKVCSGRRIIPSLNDDDNVDVKNESYACFRRREVKAVRKTRCAQSSSTDKLQRLQKELATAQEFAKALCQREALKRQMLTHAHNVWTQRKSVADLLQLFPSFGAKGDEELLVDHEPAPKKRKTPAEPRAVSPTATRHAKAAKTSKDPKNVSSTSFPFTPITKGVSILRPQERYNMVLNLEQEELQSMVPNHPDWEDFTEDAYEDPALPFAEQFFSPLPAAVVGGPLLDSGTDDDAPFEYRSVRVRRGRGGVLRMDRRLSGRRARFVNENPVMPPRHSLDAENVEEDAKSSEETARRLRSQWMFDLDGGPVDSLAPHRLVNEYERKYIRTRPLFLRDTDVQQLAVDGSLSWPTEENGTEIRSTHIFGPDLRELEKAKRTFDRARAYWARAAASRAQPVPPPRPEPSRIYTQASSSPVVQDTSTDLDAPPLTAGSSTPSSCSSADTPPTPVSASLFAPPELACKDQAQARSRSAHPVRGAMNMPCVPATPQLDLAALSKRYGALSAASTPSRSPSVTRTPSHPHA